MTGWSEEREGPGTIGDNELRSVVTIDGQR
jgi:hypothetical protein